MLLFEGCSARDRTLPPKTKLVKEKVHTPQRAVAMPEHGRFNKNEKKKENKPLQQDNEYGQGEWWGR